MRAFHNLPRGSTQLRGAAATTRALGATAAGMGQCPVQMLLMSPRRITEGDLGESDQRRQ